GQGQIDKILSAKPEERRELFDEAAGIVKFKRRKNTALKKLEEEQQNLTRVRDILGELSRQLVPLEKQSETARVYLKKKETLKQLDIQMFLAEMERIRSQMKETEGKYKIVQSDLEETAKNFKPTRTEYDRLEKELEKLEEEIQAAREESTEKTLKKQQLENQIHILQEQINFGRQRDIQYEDRMKNLEEDLEKRREEAEKCKAEKAELAEKTKAFQKSLEETQA